MLQISYLPDKPTAALFSAGINVQKLFHKTTLSDLSDVNLSWIVRQANDITDHCQDLGNAVFGSLLIGMGLSILLWLAATLNLVVDYRHQV